MNPINNAAPGFSNTPAEAPIITPPAIVAFNRCSISNFFERNALVIKVARQLPVNDNIVFEIIWLLVNGVFAKYPKLKEGQYIYKKRVPKKAKITEL